MIKYKPLFYISIVLVLITTIASISYPHTYSLAEHLFIFVESSIETKSGLRIINMVLVVMLLLSMVAAYFSLNKYKLLSLVVILVIFGTPSFGIALHKSFFAEGIYSVTYNEHKSNCYIEDNHLLCDLYFLNQSNKPVDMNVSFLKIFHSEEQLVEVLNEKAPYEIKLATKDKQPIKIETNINHLNNKQLKKLEKKLNDPSSYSLHIRIEDGKNNRDL